MLDKSKGRSRKCLFCGQNLLGVRSQEHVFPQWLLKQLDISNEQAFAVHVFQEDDPATPAAVISSRRLALTNIREGRVCAGCNNGWMSQLEQACCALLIPLIEGLRRPEDLVEKECLAVARWAAKTAYMLNSSANFPIKVHPDHLTQLRNVHGKLPWGVLVLATTAPFTRFGWCQSVRWQLCGPDQRTSRIAGLMDTRTYKIGIHLGRLILVVAWHSIPGWWKMLWKQEHTVIWPWHGKCGWHYDDSAVLKAITAQQVLPLHLSEIKLVDPYYLLK